MLLIRLSMLALLTLVPLQATAQGMPLSYAISVVDEVGSTGSAAAALGVADYVFINDFGLGFGGTSMDTFDVGEVAVFSFVRPLRSIAGQHDLVISAFVGGLGEIDNASIQVDVSSDGTTFVNVATFDTDEARAFRLQDWPERDYEGVKHYWIDFGAEDNVTHVRLTNLAGTSEGLRLDSIEGLHPDTTATHSFEIRFERYREDFSERFLLRIKNTSDAITGQPITGFFIEKAPVNGFSQWMEETNWFLPASDGVGGMICVINCVGDADNLPGVSTATLAFSSDGVVVAPPGIGLEPGRHVYHERYSNWDLDTSFSLYLTDFIFYVEFADGFRHEFDFNNDVVPFGNLGNLYQKYGYFSNPPTLSGPRQVHHYEAIELPEPSAFLGLASGGLVLLGLSRRKMRRFAGSSKR